MAIVRSVIALAASRHWYIYQIGVYNAILNGDLMEEVYMKHLDWVARQGAVLRSANFRNNSMASNMLLGNGTRN